MTTTVMFKKKKVKVVTQAYEVGLYVAVYFPNKSIPEQMGIDMPEKEFHQDVRSGNFFRGAVKIIENESSIIE